MNKKLIISILVLGATIIALIVFNNVASRVDDSNQITEAKLGNLDITISGTGELFAEHSVEIKAPEMIQRNQGGQGGHGGGGGDIRLSPLRIQDLIPEGTIVKVGDYIAQLDRTEYDNTMKDDLDRLKNYETNLEMMILDSAVTLTALRDEIKNQRATVSEREMTFRNSKYESPDVIRQAEINFEQSKRILEQRIRTYELRVAQTNQNIKNTQFYLGRVKGRIDDTKELLDKFTITSPGDGMLIYKRDFRGSKRKVGTMISPFDRVIATIPDLTSMFSRTFISEIEISKIKPGLNVDITIDAFPQKSYKGRIETVANIGETLPNSDSKVFETNIRIDGSDPALRPSMTTGNKILVSSFQNVIYIPTECIMTGTDSVTFVYTRNRTRQVVVPGESNDKFTVIEKGLKTGTRIYISEPENHDNYRLSGKEFIPEIKEKARQRTIMAGRN
jgi:multidrug efflux pump subunit AcrA (membrane-fusion protein)